MSSAPESHVNIRQSQRETDLNWSVSALLCRRNSYFNEIFL